MNPFGYIIVDIVMIVVTLGALWRRQWVPLGLYLIADAVYAYELLRSNGKTGWDDLADLATLLVIVAPIYLIATIYWVFDRFRRRKASSR